MLKTVRMFCVLVGGIAVTAAELIAAGEQLAQPCLILSEAQPGEPVVGVWGNDEISDENGNPLWIRVDCTWLRQHGFDLDGYLSIYADRDTSDFIVVHTPHARMPTHERVGIPLSGIEGRSLPQEEAILALREAETGEREVLSAEAIRPYRGRWLDSAFAGWATLGGWRMSWPEDDDDPEDLAFWQVDRRLVLRTSHDSEPWVEVWMHSDGHLEAIERIT